MRRVMEAAYAKVNLTLAVTGRRADGYHTIESLFQSVSLCDKLTLEQRERGFWLNETAGIPAEENIITRADRLLRREFPNLGGVAVTLEKNIPTQAGLGGGSADAAVQALLDGSLGYDPEARCDHHDHAHGAGHTCGEHGCGEHSCHS